MRVKCLAQEHNTMSLARTRTCTLTMRPPRLGGYNGVKAVIFAPVLVFVIRGFPHGFAQFLRFTVTVRRWSPLTQTGLTD